MIKDEARSGGAMPGRVTRRTFLARGAASGAWLAFGAPLGLLAAPAAHGQIRQDELPIDRLVLEFDGKPVALLKRAFGGNTVLGLADPVTNDPRASTLSVNELYLEAMLLSAPFVDWIRASLAGKAAPRSIDVVTYSGPSVHRHALSGARLTEVSRVGLKRDGSFDMVGLGFRVAADLASARWSAQAAAPTWPPLSNNPARGLDSVVWVQGLEVPLALASSVSWEGLRRRPDGQWIAGPLVLRMPAGETNPFEEWMDLVLRGQAGDRSGGIRLYDQSRTRVLASIDFPALGISSIQLSERAPQHDFDLATVELYCRGGAKFSLNGLTM